MISYWVITPEGSPESTSAAIRGSWLKGAEAQSHFCVAGESVMSTSSGITWLHGLNRSSYIPSNRSALNADLRGISGTAGGTLASRENALPRGGPEPSRIKRLYNNFLRFKVFEMFRRICADRENFDYAFLMDADTAVNRTNLQAFVDLIGTEREIFTGLCKRKWSWSAQGQRPRSVGGGPGMLFSRPLLNKVCPSLDKCAPLRTLMDRLEMAGGDLMLSKCMEFLGQSCSISEEISPKLTHRLDDLFRRGPPWVYPPMPLGTILVAAKDSGIKAIEQHHRLRSSEGAALNHQVISFHRVQPSSRSEGFLKDPRCRVFGQYTKLESGPFTWFSRCLPAFVIIGTPKSGTTSLFNWLLQHPDVRAPLRKELHMWVPLLQPSRACLDRVDCLYVSPPKNQKDSRVEVKPTWPLHKETIVRVLWPYLQLYPRIDPRDFAITGEGSPAYLYSASAMLFLQSQLMGHTKLVVLLRDPADRTYSEFKNKRDLMRLHPAGKAGNWIGFQDSFDNFSAGVAAVAKSCSTAELYESCVVCERFRAAPGPQPRPRAALRSRRRREECAVQPVIWQSWYHLFLPTWLNGGSDILLEYSDDMFSDSAAVMRRVGEFVGLPDFNFSTDTAYNTEHNRGAYIAKSPEQAHFSGKGRGKSNTIDASSTLTRRVRAKFQSMAIIESIVAHSVRELERELRHGTWKTPPMQLRTSLPQAWLHKYQQYESYTA